MRDSLQQHLHIAGHLFVFVLVLSIGSFVVHNNQQNLEQRISSYVTHSEKYMLELAQITDRNGTDESTALIIDDCPRRVEYESFLVRLGSLSKQDLISMQNLFESCGSFYTVRKAIMVSKLEREYESYSEYIALLDELTDVQKFAHSRSLFKQIVELENERSQLIKEQTDIQSKIISLLITGRLPGSNEVSELITEAHELAQLLSVIDRKVDDLRASIVL